MQEPLLQPGAAEGVRGGTCLHSAGGQRGVRALGAQGHRGGPLPGHLQPALLLQLAEEEPDGGEWETS